MISEYEAAKQVSETLLDVNERLCDSLRMVQKTVPDHEYRVYAMAVGRIVNGIFESILEPIYMRHKSLKPPNLEM